MSLSLNINALVDAAWEGNIDEVNRLLAIQEVSEAATHYDNEAFREAARGGHLPVVERLLQIDAVREQATARNNEALRNAAANGYLPVVERLLLIPAVLEQATAGNNAALRAAAANDHLPVVDRLRQIPAVAAADLLSDPSDESDIGFDSGLSDSDMVALAPGGPGDIIPSSKEREAKVRAASEEELRLEKILSAYFRPVHLAINDGDVKALTEEIFQIKAEGLEKYLARDNNYLLLYAISNSPEDKVDAIVEKLLESLVIRQAEGTEGRSTYRAAQNAARKKGLEKLAQKIAKAVSEIELSSAQEGSMRELSPARARLKAILTKKYGHLIPDAKTRQNIIEEIKQYIAKEYSKAPAKVRKLGQEQSLPLERLKRELTEEELAAYYQHEIHTAHRYFLNPNPWMSPNASHVAGDPLAGTGHALIQEQDEEFFALLWLAVHDKDLPVPHMEGASQEKIEQARLDYIDTFIREFAELNRSHNRDSLKDDGEGDKPTCQWGVTNRMAGFLELRMAIPILSLEQIKTRFATDIVDKVIESFDQATLEEFGNILEKMVTAEELNKQEIGFIQSLAFDDLKVLGAFKKECNAIFSEDDNPEPLSKKGQAINWTGVGGNQKFDTYNELIHFLSEDPMRTVEIYLQRLYDKVHKKKKEMEKMPTLKPS